MKSPEMQLSVSEHPTAAVKSKTPLIEAQNSLIITADDGNILDAPTNYLQSIFDNETVLKELVTNGPRKAPILEKAKQQINSPDPQEKIIFLEKTFAILSDPNPEHQDKRDVALELLNIMNLKSIEPKVLIKTYIKAAYNLREGLNEDSDPYGEIHMLLEAGKIIAPFIEKSLYITRAWNCVAKAFTGSDRQKILDDIQQIRKLTSGEVSEFDARVLIFLEKGLRDQDIATELGVPILNIQRSTSRLKRRGIKLGSFNRGRGRVQTEQRKQLFEAVKDLRNKGMGNLEISNELTKPRTIIKGVVNNLIKKGEIPRIKNSGLKKNV